MHSPESLVARIREQGGEIEYLTAQASVLLCAISALVETHPDSGAFAKAFQAQWSRIGNQNQAQPDDSMSSEGMDDALGVLEESCPVPLNVRPPGVAAKPLRK